MTFIGQFRGRDIRAAPVGTRRARLILFFSQVEEEEPGVFPPVWAGDCTRVLRIPRGVPLTRTAAPRRHPRLVLRPSRVTMTRAFSLPDMDYDFRLAPPLSDLVLHGDLWERWFDLDLGMYPPRGPIHRLLGFPVTPNGFGGSCSARTLRRAVRHWRLLLRLDSDTRLRWEVADAGAIQFLIRPGDLRRGRFDRVCAAFDSA